MKAFVNVLVSDLENFKGFSMLKASCPKYWNKKNLIFVRVRLWFPLKHILIKIIIIVCSWFILVNFCAENRTQQVYWRRVVSGANSRNVVCIKYTVFTRIWCAILPPHTSQKRTLPSIRLRSDWNVKIP